MCLRIIGHDPDDHGRRKLPHIAKDAGAAGLLTGHGDASRSGDERSDVKNVYPDALQA
jgi:hypothetical protein